MVTEWLSVEQTGQAPSPEPRASSPAPSPEPRAMSHRMTSMPSPKTANLATRSVRYLEAGTGPIVLLLHAFPLNAEQWLPQVSKGVPGWKLIAPDLRGFGPV